MVMPRRSRLRSLNVLVRASNGTGIEIPSHRPTAVNRVDRLRALLNDPAGRRFVAEFLVVAIGIAALTAVLAAALQSAFPDPFAAGSDGFSRYDWPDTRLEGVQALVGTALLGVYFYWRLFFTELGDEVRTLAETELLGR